MTLEASNCPYQVFTLPFLVFIHVHLRSYCITDHKQVEHHHHILQKRKLVSQHRVWASVLNYQITNSKSSWNYWKRLYQDRPCYVDIVVHLCSTNRFQSLFIWYNLPRPSHEWGILLYIRYKYELKYGVFTILMWIKLYRCCTINTLDGQTNRHYRQTICKSNYIDALPSRWFS